MGQVVVVDQLGVAENLRRLAEHCLDFALVHVDLHFELGFGVEESQAVVIGLGDQFDPSRVSQVLEGLQRFRRQFFQLFDDRAGDRQAEFELGIMFQELEQPGVGRQVGFLGDFLENTFVAGLVVVGSVEIIMVHTAVKQGIVPHPVRLVDVQVEHDGFFHTLAPCR